MAGNKAGDVGVWNCHMRVGGAAGTQVRTGKCAGSPPCRAAWGMLHITSTASVYIENMWGKSHIFLSITCHSLRLPSGVMKKNGAKRERESPRK